jgi:hypothetical protein
MTARTDKYVRTVEQFEVYWFDPEGSSLSRTQISEILCGPGTIIGAFCNSCACLTPMK